MTQTAWNSALQSFHQSATLTERRTAVRNWVGSSGGNPSSLSDKECRTLLERFTTSPERQKTVLDRLSEHEKKIVAVIATTGGLMSADKLMTEMELRDLCGDESSHSFSSRYHPFARLIERLVILPVVWNELRYARNSWDQSGLYDLVAHPGIVKIVPPIPKRIWNPPVVAEAKRPLQWEERSVGEAAADMLAVAAFLASESRVIVNKSGSLARPFRVRMERTLAMDASPSIPLPDPGSLHYEILRGMKLFALEEGKCVIATSSEITNAFARDPVALGKAWLESWMNRDLWQDGLGVVPDRDNHYDPERIDPWDLRKVRRRLIDALADAIDGAGDAWFELEPFLSAYYDRGKLKSSDHYCVDFAWRPLMRQTAQKDSYKAGLERSRAYWLDDAGYFVANVIFCTFHALGLTARATLGTFGTPGKPDKPDKPDKMNDPRHIFRFTEFGRAVLGRDSSGDFKKSIAGKFLTTLANRTIAAEIRFAAPADIVRLARIAKPLPGSGPVRSYEITRGSIDAALESGSLDDVFAFLRSRGKNDIPSNVESEMKLWAGAKEDLTLVADASLVAYTNRIERDECVKLHGGESIGDCFALMPRHAKPFAARRIDHRAECVMHAKISGREIVDIPHLLAWARLRRFAHPHAEKLILSHTSVREAVALGKTANEIMTTLKRYSEETPWHLFALIEAWSVPRPKLELKTSLLIHIPDEKVFRAVAQMDEIRRNTLSSPGEGWLVLDSNSGADVERILKETGFTPGIN